MSYYILLTVFHLEFWTILNNFNWKVRRLIRNLFSFIREIKFRRHVFRISVFWLLIQRNSGRALWKDQTFKIKVSCSFLEIPSKLKGRLQEGSNHFWQVKLFEANKMYHFNIIVLYQYCFQFRICNISLVFWVRMPFQQSAEETIDDSLQAKPDTRHQL